MNEVRPKKSLGQHFLTDQSIAQRIVEQLSPDLESVIEVGAGTGVLTQYMVNEIMDKFYVIEIDTESIDYLKENFPMLGDHLIHGDFLRADLNQYGKQNMGIIGNFPYNISSQIFFQVLKHKDLVIEVVGMVQKEMAERMAAKEGSDLRHFERADAGLVRHRLSVYRSRKRVQSAAKSEIGSHQDEAERHHRLGLRRKTFRDHRETSL